MEINLKQKKLSHVDGIVAGGSGLVKTDFGIQVRYRKDMH